MAARNPPPFGARDDLRNDYAETHALYRMLVDIRFKLLAFVPAASGVAIGVLKDGRLGERAGPVVGVGFFGLLVTIGVIVYEVRNSQVHDRAIHRLKHLEKLLGFRPSGIAVGPGGFFAERGSRLSILGIGLWHDRALGLIYGSVVGAWVWLIYSSAGPLPLPTLRGPDVDEMLIAVLVGVAVAWQIVVLSATGRSGGPIYELAPIDPGIARGCDIVTGIVREIGRCRGGWWEEKRRRADRAPEYLQDVARARDVDVDGSEKDWSTWLELVRGLGLIETTRVGVLRRFRPRRSGNDSRADARNKARRRWRLTADGSKLNRMRSASATPFVPKDDEHRALLTAFRAGVVGFDEVWRQLEDPGAPDPVERYGRGAPWCTREEIRRRVAWAHHLQPVTADRRHDTEDQP